MNDIVQLVKAKLPNEPEEEIQKDIATLRMYNPAITDDQILQQIDVHNQGAASGGSSFDVGTNSAPVKLAGAGVTPPPAFPAVNPDEPGRPPATVTQPASAAIPSKPKTSVNPVVAEAIMNKFAGKPAGTPASAGVPASPGGGTNEMPSAPDAFSPEARRALMDRVNKPTTAQLIAEALAGVGDAVSSSYGGTQTNHLAGARKIRESAAAREMTAFDQGREDREYQRKTQAQGLEDDANSEVSKLYQNLASKYTKRPIEEFTGKSATQLKTLLPVLEKAFGAEEAAESRKSGRDAIQFERENRRTERLDKNRATVVDKFNADPAVKKGQQSMDAARTIRDLAESGNPIAASSIPTYSARMSGEVGNLSEADKRPFGGSQAITERINAAMKQMATGRLSDDNKRFMIGLTQIVEKRANQNIDALARLRSRQYSKLESYGTEGELYSLLRPEGEISATGDGGSGTGWTPEKEARYQELKAKAGK